MFSAEQHQRKDEIAFERLDKAFARLQSAWQAVQYRVLAIGRVQITTENLRELDAAEEEWLTAREASAFNTQRIRERG